MLPLHQAWVAEGEGLEPPHRVLAGGPVFKTGGLPISSQPSMSCYYRMARVDRFELPSHGFGDQHVAVTPYSRGRSRES